MIGGGVFDNLGRSAQRGWLFWMGGVVRPDSPKNPTPYSLDYTRAEGLSAVARAAPRRTQPSTCIDFLVIDFVCLFVCLHLGRT